MGLFLTFCRAVMKARAPRTAEAARSGMAVTDRIHLSVEGNRKVAEILAGMLK
jgi:hypothetical protein